VRRSPPELVALPLVAKTVGMNDTVVQPAVVADESAAAVAEPLVVAETSAVAVAAFLGLIETTNQVVKSVEFVELVGSMIAVVAATAVAKQTES